MAVQNVICPAGAGNVTYHTWWPSVCRRWASCFAWNTLPDFITDCSSSRTFKQYLKTYLFSLSFWAHNNTLFYDCVKRPSSSLSRLRRFTLHYKTFSLNLNSWTYVSGMRDDWVRSLAAVSAVDVVGRTTGMYRVCRSRTEVARQRWRRSALVSRDDRTQLPRANNRRRSTHLNNTDKNSATQVGLDSTAESDFA